MSLPVTLDTRTEREVQQSVKDVLAYWRFHVSDMSQDRATRQEPGIPDLYAQSPKYGMRLWIEVKKPGGKVSKAQEEWHRRERMSGGEVYVVPSGAEMHGILERITGRKP